MAIKTFNPVTPGLRFAATLQYDVDKKEPEKALTKGLSSKAGRGSGGRISVRRKGGGHKRKYRVIDFKRDKRGIPATVKALEYDPNRNASIALVHMRMEKSVISSLPKG